jgi:KDO2-lipid IV(A) lauroyltransferase
MKSLRFSSLRLILWLVGHLPLAVAQGLGRVVGRLLWQARGRNREVTEISLGLAFPEKAAGERRELARQSLVETGKTLAEVPIMWERPVDHCISMIGEIQGADLLDDALARQQGLVLLAPHLGNWELAGLYFSTRFSMAALYSAPNMKEMESYMSRVRGRGGSELVRADRRGVLRLFSILREGGVVGILPDQNPDASGGAFAPFFGVNVLTMKLVSRLVQKTEARALVTYAERLPGAKGFRLVIEEVDERLYDPDTDVSVAGLNATVENVVRRIPAQYQWEYKRFKKRPPGEPNPYKPLKPVERQS